MWIEEECTSVMTPPPREGGGHCLAIRNGKAFRVSACVCVCEREWGAEKG